MATSSASLASVATPALALDRAKVERNIAAMRAHLDRLGVPLRPHVKTAKCREVVRQALVGQPGGVAVSTLAEAADMIDFGVTDITYAVGISPAKLDEVAALTRRGARVTILLDAVETARAVADRGRELGVRFPVLIEIDTDGHRAGVAPDAPELPAIAATLDGGAELSGVLTHAVESYNCRSTEDIAAMAERERAGAVLAAERLRAEGHECPVVSVGSTPTARFARRLDGVTEVRAGVYMFHDLVMAGLGVCPIDDIALSVVTSVIGRQESKGWVIVDAGWMALSRDRGTAAQSVDQGYGLVCDLNGQPYEDLIVSAANQEHGIITRRGGPAPVEDFAIGSRLRILPNHACATAGMHDRYQVVNGAPRIEAVWERRNGWRAD